MIQEKSKLPEVERYYDKYSVRQLKAGINARHHSILKLLKEQGLKKQMDVLEIGCGVGTLTELLVKNLKKVHLTSIDLSPQSIEIAKSRLSKFKNLDLIAKDITEWETNKKFDVIVLPDVLEHIPIEKHKEIFKKLNLLLKDDGLVFIHIPDPVYQNWIINNHPDRLQIIDQILPAAHFVESASQTGFYITRLESYSIWHRPAEYQLIVMQKRKYVENIIPIEQKASLYKKVKAKIKILLNNG